MRARYVVDTNVLIAASAGDPQHPKDIDATPREPLLRREVWSWLDQFQQSESRLVLDLAGEILREYTESRWMGFNDFGLQVVMHKWSTAAVDNVHVAYDADGCGVLPETLSHVIHDAADKKMVAAALASHAAYGEGCVAFAGDTDWHDWEGALAQHHVLLEPIIEVGEWCAARHSLDYAALPDWYLVFDVYDRQEGRFWSSVRRNALAESAGLVPVPQIAQGRQTVAALKTLVATSPSHYREGPCEGLIIRRESAQWCESRAKLVRADFAQAIETHWRKRSIEWNRVDFKKAAQR